ncbi:MAG: glucuronate isomerase [Gammaproteobacteria bacterium]|jgi:glucuronate isomerase|nr:glucuronate isomerase [Gammaproteobacteria bacterium]MBT5203299.1 glucuronate isomerase [Gammaproteobacteria bacterium]MBT5603558.1 glucuronate isomerase [Gammaproteobacteria bacterium]MBT6244441.1 glucuronate isomerase [Gammaproteobacteria bacterium]
MLHPDRLLPSDPTTRDIARNLYAQVKNLPIISPHGHTDPAWFADNQPFGNPTDLLITPDHYIFRMLFSQGISLQQLGIPPVGREAQTHTDPKQVWQIFASHYHLFRGTPSQLWLDHVFAEIFELPEQLNADTANAYYDRIDALLQTQDFLPRRLFERFNIELLATTESPLDDLKHHNVILESDWTGRVITTFRPDPVLDPEFEGFKANLSTLASITGKDTSSYSQYLEALSVRRAFFKAHGATASDHGHPTAGTANLSRSESEALFEKIFRSEFSAAEAELFRRQMLTEMAAMSLEDGLVMQIHPGSYRNHNSHLFETFGRDKGADIPVQTEYVKALKPLLDRFGNEPDLSVILFTLDETAYSRELAPLAGHYPILKLGPAWWFHDSPEGMRRIRQQTIETAGFYNTVGFNDDTRAFLSIPARHDMSRRIDCGFLAGLVAEHRMDEQEACEVAEQLAYGLVKRAYNL